MQSMSILYTTNQCLPVNSLQTNIRSNFYNVPGNPNCETALMIREYQTTLEFNPLMDGTSIDDHQITVCVRARKELDVSIFFSFDCIINN